MKTRKIATLAALPAAILAANTAMADVTVYGKVNWSLQNSSAETDRAGVKTTTEDEWQLNSNASRFGIKASKELGDTGLKAIAKLEYEVFVDDGDDGSTISGITTTCTTTCTPSSQKVGSEFKQRNIYGGLQGGFGTLIAGKFDTPVKKAQKKVDLFNDLKLGDIKNVIEGENRESNIIQYSTPKMDNGVGVNLAVIPGEGSDYTGDGDVDDSIADGVSASITYDAGPVYVALATDRGVDEMDSLVRVVGQFKATDDLTLGVIVQRSEKNDDDTTGADEADEQDAVVVSAAYKIGKAKLKAQYATSETEDVSVVGGSDIEKTAISVGVDYKLDKKSKVYAYYTDWQEDNNAAVAGDDDSADTFGVGYEYKF